VGTAAGPALAGRPVCCQTGRPPGPGTELHLRFDAVAVAYRKAMRDLGLAASGPIGIPAE
jgi:hypothetical protein